jgi:large subunit ribosomal protein L6
MFEKKIKLRTKIYTNLLKHYYAENYKKSFPKISAPLGLALSRMKRSIIACGVGFKKYIRVRGVGYKLEFSNNLFIAKVGYTHNLQKIVPSDFIIKFSRKSKVARIRCKSLNRLTSFTSMFRALKKPDVYKGKGIRYQSDPVRRKPGKRKTKAVSKKKKVNIKKDLYKKLKKKKRHKRKIKISFK